MRNIFLVVSISILSVAGLQAQKFGYMNSAAFVASLPTMQEADSILTSFQQQKTTEGENMVKQLENLAISLEKKKQEGTISPKDYEAQVKNLQAEEQKILKFQEQAGNELNQKRSALVDPVIEKVNQAIQAVAKEKGLDYVFDTSTGILLYAEEGLDVTEAVKTKLATL